MEMCYDGALVMPSSYAVMKEDEMVYVDGGFSIGVSKKLLDKQWCMKWGAVHDSILGLSQTRIASELYAHAYLYYASNSQVAQLISRFKLAKSAVDYIRNRAEVITIGDDAKYRVTVFNTIWKYL